MTSMDQAETLATRPAAAKRPTARYPIEGLVKLRARLVPSHILGEIMSKQWIDSAVPATFMVLVIGLFLIVAPGFFTGANISDGGRQLGEFGLVALGMMVVIMGGGIDLSVGSIFALGNFTALALTNLFDWPVAAVLPCVILICALAGLINGVLIGYFRLRAFLTTLVSLITIRALVDVLLLEFAVDISAGFYDSAIWDFAGAGNVLGLPTYVAWWLQADHAAKLPHHERVLRLLQSHRPPHHWLLKSPDDLHDLEHKVDTAMGMHGARYLHVLVPCPVGWGTSSADTVRVARLAAESGFFPVFEARDGEVTDVRRIRRRVPVKLSSPALSSSKGQPSRSPTVSAASASAT